MLKKNKIDLVILAGGVGSRIKEYLRGKPKPMVKLNNKYFLNYIINNVSKYNFNKIIILTRFRHKIIHQKFNNKNFNFIKVECINEKKKMGTGGALGLIKNKVNDFILLNGDTLFDIDFSVLIKNIKKNSLGAIALKTNNNQKSKKLNRLKLKGGNIYYSKYGKLMNGGVYFFKKEFLKFIPKGESSLENEVLPNLILRKKISGKIFKNFFIDIGSRNFFKKAPKLLFKHFSKRAAFLDRDGVINYDYGYVHNIKKFKFRKGVIKGLKLLTKNNFYIFIITNQAGIGKNIFNIKNFEKLHLELKEKFINQKINVNEVKFSPYHKNAKISHFKKNSKFRKPGNLMIESIFKSWDVKRSKSFMIGDKKTDLLAARKSKLKFYYAEKDFYNQIKSII